MFTTGSPILDADEAFARMSRSRRRAAVARRLRRQPPERDRLPVIDETTLRGARALPRPGIREIPLDAIQGTLEPGRARVFDRAFRPAEVVAARWKRLWLAEYRGATLPPISVVDLGGGYAIRDGHHRVSVARARGAITIDATIEFA
jgi:hypothetical protein